MSKSNGNPGDYIRTDEHGVLRVGDTDVPLDSVVIGFQNGESAETIWQNYPSLSLEEVYGAVAYYLGHRAEVESYLLRQNEVWNQWEKKFEGMRGPTMQELRTRLEARAGHEI